MEYSKFKKRITITSDLFSRTRKQSLICLKKNIILSKKKNLITTKQPFSQFLRLKINKLPKIFITNIMYTQSKKKILIALGGEIIQLPQKLHIKWKIPQDVTQQNKLFQNQLKFLYYNINLLKRK